MKRSDILGATHTGYLVSLDVSVPLFSRGQTSVASAAAQARAAEADAEALRRQIDADVRAAHAALAVQRDRTERYTTSMAESVESLASVARLGYEEGELGILELLDAVRQSLDGRLRALDLAATARQAAIELDRVVGREIRP
jgi:outer membrane protein TolC